jgi:peptidyl-prolyl cis-trans isomerase SurA
MIRPIAAVAGFSLALALSMPMAAAQSRIQVVVNDQAITTYQIAQRARLIQLTTKQPNSQSLATQELIDDILKLGEAKRMNVAVSKEEVDDAFATIAERVKLKPDQLAKALAQSGASAQTLKERLRAQIAWAKVVRQRFSKQLNVSDPEVIAALQRKGGEEERKTIQFDLAQVMFVVPGKAAAGVEAQRKREAEALRARFTSCADGLDYAKSLPEVVVKVVGKRLQSDIGDELTKQLDETAVGHLTPPERTPTGFELIAVCDKRVLESDAAARAKMQNEMLTAESEIVAKRYLRDVRSNAVIDYR